MRLLKIIALALLGLCALLGMFRALAVGVALLVGTGMTSDGAGYFTGTIFVEWLLIIGFVAVWRSLRRAKRR